MIWKTRYSFLTILIILIIVIIICKHRTKIAKIRKEQNLESEKEKTKREEHQDDTLLRVVELLVGKRNKENDTSPPNKFMSSNDDKVVQIEEFILEKTTSQIMNNIKNSKEEKSPAHSQSNEDKICESNLPNFFNNKE